MGLIESGDYTACMMRDDPPAYLSGTLTICPALGQVTSAAGASVRLGPVNMKVLEALVTRAGSVVSRAELYDVVWRNQAVGEDALTRCVSDIRAELRTLSDRDDWIETLPKRGYRWIREVSKTSLGEGPAGGPVPAPPESVALSRGSRALPTKALRLVGRGIAYLVALALMGSSIVWTFDRLSDSRMPVVAVLPLSAAAELSDLAAELDLELTKYLIGLEQIQVLSRSAIESRPSNPFPFFYYEFGARWLVESDVREVSRRDVLTINVADARTGIVELQVAEPIPSDGAHYQVWIETVFSALNQFIQSSVD
jgi:DNA-binding winged helix-turn-helix (wHTH) protein